MSEVQPPSSPTHAGCSVLDASWRHKLVIGLGAGGGVMALLLIVQRSTELPLFLTSWASSTALILTARDQPASAPATVFVAHCVCGFIGIAFAMMASYDQRAIIPAFGLSMFAMLITGRVHPPAAANAVIVILMPAVTPRLMLETTTLGGVCLAMLALTTRSAAVRRLCGR